MNLLALISDNIITLLIVLSASLLMIILSFSKALNKPVLIILSLISILFLSFAVGFLLVLFFGNWLANIVMLILSLLLLLLSGTMLGKAQDAKNDYLENVMGCLTITSIVLFMSIGISWVIYSPTSKVLNSNIMQRDTTLSERIAAVSVELNNVSSELSDIQIELEERIKLVEDLKMEADTAQAIMNLSQEQIKAIDNIILRYSVESTQSSLYLAIVQGIITTIAGALLGYLLPKILQRFLNQEKPPSSPDDIK